MTLQEYLGNEYVVTQITDEQGKISFNIKRDEFEYTSIHYNLRQLPSIIKILGMTVETRYGSWKFSQELK